jgi:hypothetical protein
MKLRHGRHLAYCTNIHRGETWPEIFEALQRHTLAVRAAVPGASQSPFAIGLRLSAIAARELSDPTHLSAFRTWLDRHDAYVFTINGFPFGKFHGTRVKEQVYAPDWTHPERVEYTKLLFDLLAQLVPEGVDGSVSTVPVSFKAFGLDARALDRARQNLWSVVEHIERLTRSSGRPLHLGLEPEPLCTLETSSEAVEFFERLRADRPGDLRLNEHLGLNYDCCHLAVEFENAAEALERLRRNGILLSKIHLSSALRVRPATDSRLALAAFADDTYLHQVVQRSPDGSLRRFIDLPDALATANLPEPTTEHEWRIHFHVPLHHPPGPFFETTADHVSATLDWLKDHPGEAQHLEMETYTWEVLPPELKARGVVDQLAAEYAWTLDQLRARGLA